MKLTKDSREKYYQFILDSIEDPQKLGYSYKFDSSKDINGEKIRVLFAVFNDEYGWSIERNGESRALKEWLSGLPSIISLPFSNHDILQLAKKFGTLAENATEKQEDHILLNYYGFMAMQLTKLKKRYLS